jgi:hypothetical protein
MAVGGRGEMAYAAGLGPVGGDTVGVQIPPPALKGTRERRDVPFIGVVGGFGETAYAGDLVDTKSTSVTVFETFSQTVYQFASTHGAASFYSQLNAKYRSCRTVTSSDGKGGFIRRTVRSQSKQRVGGHQAVQLVESVSFSTIPGPPLVIYVLWTIDGTDVYMISTTPLSTSKPQPTQSSLTLKLIARVSHLR